MNIRNIEEKDNKNLEHICLATADECFLRDEKSKEITLLKYNRYYMRQERENSFALVNDNDEAVGYILCAKDFKHYKKSFCKNELHQIAKYGLLQKLAAYGEIIGNSLYCRSYPAHLHIDILPEYQGGGNGTKLMNILVDSLKSKGVSGVMLGVSAQNKRAIGFYRKNGFEVLMKTPMAYLMGRKL